MSHSVLEKMKICWIILSSEKIDVARKVDIDSADVAGKCVVHIISNKWQMGSNPNLGRLLTNLRDIDDKNVGESEKMPRKEWGERVDQY